MKRILSFSISLFLLITVNAQDSISGLDYLAECMQGSFNSAEQAKKDTNYFDISLEMKRIWPEQKDGIWLYVEQAVTAAKQRPYRQRIYCLKQLGKNEFTSTIYKIPHAENYIGAYSDPSKFNDLEPDVLDELEGCTIQLSYQDDAFSGATEKGKCTNSWGKADYATSEVTITAKQMLSWDRGWNEDGEQVWGAEKGGYIFVKQ